MPWQEDTMMNPPIETLLELAGSKFMLVTLAASRAREVNAYFNHLGDGRWLLSERYGLHDLLGGVEGEAAGFDGGDDFRRGALKDGFRLVNRSPINTNLRGGFFDCPRSRNFLI